MSDFGEQLPIGKPKLEFIVNEQGMISMKVSGNFHGMYQIAVGYNGIPLAVVPFTGLGAPMPPYPKPSLLAWILSDQSGMWGRRCPVCGTYFRTNHVMENTACPYCGSVSSSLSFITEAQGKYVTAFCNAYIEAANTKSTVTIDLESVTDSSPEWSYAEERQQFHFKCKNCHIEADILGEYGWCPKCGRSNCREIIEDKLKQLEQSFEMADKNLSDKAKRSEQMGGDEQ